tara:strand:- start:396 stop:521 length:126 start_codon:yes stop_codon:yes gene_type:complete
MNFLKINLEKIIENNKNTIENHFGIFSFVNKNQVIINIPNP